MLKVTKFQLPTLYHLSTAEGKPSQWEDSTLPVCLLGLKLHLWISNPHKKTDQMYNIFCQTSRLCHHNWVLKQR